MTETHEKLLTALSNVLDKPDWINFTHLFDSEGVDVISIVIIPEPTTTLQEIITLDEDIKMVLQNFKDDGYLTYPEVDSGLSSNANTIFYKILFQ